MAGRNALRAMDPGFGPICPDCGGPKHKTSRQCMDCYDLVRPDTTSLYSLSRRESTITFERGGETRTVSYCTGKSREEQVADGRNRLPGDDWQVVCISTPLSILNDLSAAKMNWKGQAGRRRHLN